MLKILRIFVLASLLAACAPFQSTTEQPLPTPSVQWTSVTMIQSGGIMGMMRTIKITNKGAANITDERADKKVTGQLTDAQLAQLEDLVSAMSTVPSSNSPSGCADCFNYSIAISSSSKPIRAELDDVTLPDSSLAPLVDFLRGIMDEMLK